MIFKKLHNKRLTNSQGFTLIEVLASLALLSVIVILATSLTMTASSNKQVIQGGLNLQQQTNLLTMDMRNTYISKSGTGNLAFSIDSKRIQIKELVINGEKRAVTSPIEGIDFNKTLNLKLTTANKNGETLTIKTTWHPVTPTHLTVK